jgi:hypothetical protein
MRSDVEYARDHAGQGHGQHHRGLWARVKHVLVPHAHDSNEAIQTADGSSGQGIRAAWIGLTGMAVTAILQAIIVAASGSIALLADTLHNVGHAVTTIPLVIGFRIGRWAATERYSFRRAEDLVGVVIHLNPAVDGAEPADSHELTAHHKSRAAREAYRALHPSRAGD